MILIENDTIARVDKIMAGIPGGAEKALAAALNRGLQKVKTDAYRHISETYDITRENARMDSNVKLRQASASAVAGAVEFSGRKIPLFRYNAAPAVPMPGRPVRAGQMKGRKQTFDNAFVARFKSGHITIVERVPGKVAKSRSAPNGETKHNQALGAIVQERTYDQFYGSSVAQMLDNPAVMARIETDARETVEKRVEHEMLRILQGYGGDRK